ncbi:MAG: methyltransferase domain-containing protein [Alphaproteobacteria bacterium]|nr:methyltransferase domain-containing protein [Alphaproteobacteria bacterium]
MSQEYSDVVRTARDYYNSEDADNFYLHIWGGEDIHIGLYESEREEIATASRRTVERLADLLPPLGKDAHILDIGSGYGGAARYLAKRFGCKVTALNLSEKENARNRELSEAAGLGDLVNVVDGSFEAIPVADGSVDAVWSQDAILHSGKRDVVIAEVARALKPGGHFVFTDPMESGNCGREDLEPVLARIHLDTLGSPAFYEKTAKGQGLEFVDWQEKTPQLIRHYSRVGQELAAQRAGLKGKVSEDYIDRMLVGLGNWVKAGEKGCLAWGFLHFKKPEA